MQRVYFLRSLDRGERQQVRCNVASLVDYILLLCIRRWHPENIADETPRAVTQILRDGGTFTGWRKRAAIDGADAVGCARGSGVRAR